MDTYRLPGEHNPGPARLDTVYARLPGLVRQQVGGPDPAGEIAQLCPSLQTPTVLFP